MTDFTYQTECLSRDLIIMLMERQQVGMQEALRLLYSSDTYAKLKDPRSGFYFQSPGYVYDFLDKEIHNGSMSSL